METEPKTEPDQNQNVANKYHALGMRTLFGSAQSLQTQA
jgi:hypothetical protein